MPHLHLIYIHGFRGDHTSFQAFPTDVYHAVRAKLPAEYELSSYLYPTYPSVRPIAYAAQQFLQWLEKQPYGPVILFAHSMGGLLAAEAATSSAEVSKRIVGLVGLDVPFLGLHPHVIISGIASLLPKDDPKVPAEKELNGHQVHIVPEHDAFQRANDSASDTSSTHSGRSSLHSSIDWATHFVDRHRDHPVVEFLQRHKDDPLGGVHRWIVKNLEFGSSMYDARGLLQRYDALTRWQGRWLNYWTTTVPLPNIDYSAAPELLDMPPSFPALTPGLGKQSGNPVLSLPFGQLSKQDSDDPKATPKWWHSALPAEHEVYSKFLSYFSGKKGDHSDNVSPTLLSPNDAQLRPSSPSPSNASSTSASSTTGRSPHHFIVLPYNGGGRRAKWHSIVVTGATDEVSAHQGIFMRHINPDYDNFVERVARLVAFWSRNL